MGGVCGKPADDAGAGGGTGGGAPAPPARAPPARSASQPSSHLRSGRSVRDAYKFGRTIGTGGFSVVKLVTDRATGEEWACKVMSLPPPGRATNEHDSSREDVFKEIDILMSLRHPNIIALKEYFQENNKIYIIMEYLRGGELLEAVINAGHYSEADARAIFRQLLEGVRYMHEERHTVHRDLKLENLLLARPGDTSTVKIADFGLAKRAAGPGGGALSTICGTPQYVAPEVIRGGRDPVAYGAECDLWSAGIILYILLAGYPPFWDESEPKLFSKIRAGKYDFKDRVWDSVSPAAKDLVSRLLQVDPAKRATVAEALAHEWLRPPGAEPGRRDLLAAASRLRDSVRRRDGGGLGAALSDELKDELDDAELGKAAA